MHTILFEDSQVKQLEPAVLARPAFAVSCGGYRLIDLVQRLNVPIEWSVRSHLQELVRADFPELLPCDLSQNADDHESPVLLLNARLVPHVALLDTLQKVIHAKQAGAVMQDGCLAAALLTSPCDLCAGGDDASRWYDVIQEMQLPTLDIDMPLLQYAHDIVRHHMRILNDNLNDRLSHGTYREITDGLFVAVDAFDESSVQLGEHLVTDTSDGPILLERGVRVGPHCYINGPALIGENTKIIEHASIKDGVAVGHTCKIGGEVETSIIEPLSNKQHHGFLGHSYLGSWINLGAGTCNSDLKNTYGRVTMQYENQRVDTGMQFMGCIVGDYTKTAINTSIFTGKTIGVCSMLYGFATTNVPSFVNYARTFGQETEVPVDVMLTTQQRMFVRRAVEQRECDVWLLRDLFELTRDERNGLQDSPLQF